MFSGTLVVAGQGLALVTATGPATEMGKIGRSLGTIELEATPLQRQMGRIVVRLAVAGAALCLLVAVLYGRSRGSLFDGLLAGLALAMSILPEEFPVVLTIFLALGAWRLSRKRVLTRRVAAIEALGAATVLCVDKTGTLTVNRMSVSRLVAGGEILQAAGRRNASRGVSRARGVRCSRQPDVAFRSDGTGDSRARPADACPDRAPPRGLGAPARVSSVARKARRHPRLEGSRARGVRDRGQRGAGSDCGPVSSPDRGGRSALRVSGEAGGGRAARSRGGPRPLSQRRAARKRPRLPLRAHGSPGPRGSPAGVGPRGHPRLQSRGNPGRHDHRGLPGHRREDREGDRAARRLRDDGSGARRTR